MHVEEALSVLENHLLNLGGLGCPSGVLLQVGVLLAWDASVNVLSPQCAFAHHDSTNDNSAIACLLFYTALEAAPRCI